jgi:hypothetical protein
MSSTRTVHKKEKERKTRTFRVKGGNTTADLEQTYSLESLNQGYELGGFSYSNIFLGILGLGTIWYMVNQEQNKTSQ